MTLSRTIKTAVNRRAHAAGRLHAEQVKRRVLAELEALRGAGISHADLLAAVEARLPTDNEDRDDAAN